MASQTIKYTNTTTKTYKRRYKVKKTSQSKTRKLYSSTLSKARSNNKGNQNHCPLCGAFTGNKGKKG